MPSGVAVGEVTATSAVLWGRCSRAATLRFRPQAGGTAVAVEVDASTDFAGRATVRLDADTPAKWKAWCEDRDGDASAEAMQLIVRPAPAASEPRAVRFAFGGDVGGQNVCRDAERGYPIFDRIAARQPDFFIGLGDMIYADDQCRRTGRYGDNPQIPGPPPATDLNGFRAHWRYNRADTATQRLLAATPYYPVWDDHEIQNDSGPHDDRTLRAPGTPLLPIALRAFLDYQPLIPPTEDPTRLYRSVRWGRHVEVFLLDTRQYRDANAAPDSAARPKTMLGAAQLAWLERAVRGSDATWKVLVASVPLSIPTGGGARDGFASGDADTGFEAEAARIFRLLRDAGVRNHLWITTDVHFATGFRYRPFDDDPDWTSVELISGPLNAGIFPNLGVDPTFHPERLFLHAPASVDAVPSFDAALGWFNFGVIDVAADGTLSASIINGHGEVVYQLHMAPQPE